MMADKKIVLASPIPRRHDIAQQNNIDWNKCYICQEHSTEKLSCPATYEKTPQGKSRGYVAANEYERIEQSFNDLHNYSELPADVNAKALDEGDGIAKTLISHDAKHHRSCFQKIKPVRVAQAEKRAGQKRKSNVNETPRKWKSFTRTSLQGKKKL